MQLYTVQLLYVRDQLFWTRDVVIRVEHYQLYAAKKTAIIQLSDVF
jgi:hypothetical protein